MMSEAACNKPEHRSHLPTWSSRLLDRSSVLHFFTQRSGGVSPPPYDTLNLGYSTRDKPENVSENRRRVGEAFRLKLRSLAIQVHGDQVLVLKSGSPVPQEGALTEADAILSDIPGLPVAVFFGDCLPIFFWDSRKKAGGIAHAGWRSTLLYIGPRCVESLELEFGSRPGDLEIALGPSIGPCCFEVGPEVAALFAEKFKEGVVTVRAEKTFVNLWEANKQLLLAKGVEGGRMELAQECTFCLKEKYFSYRRDKQESGRMAGVLKIPD